MLSGWFLIASFIPVPNLCIDVHPCNSVGCNTGCVGTEADATKLLMAITIIPALIAIIVTIQPLILIRKTSFKKNTKLALAIIATVLAINTIISPVSIIVAAPYKQAVKNMGTTFMR